MFCISVKSGIRLRIFSVLTLTLSVVGFCSLFYSNSVFAEAKQSTLTVNMTQGVLAISLTPSGDGTFGKSSDSTIGINTDNYSGYSMKIVSTGSTSLVNSNDDEIQSISSAISESTFSSSTTYNNKWGYVPSQYISNNTVVSNTDYLPAPSSAGDLLAKTSLANSVDDTYTLSFGARVDHQLPPGTYQYTFVLQIIANPIVFNITYDDNTTDTVTNMPSPNPQVVNIDGGTPAAESYATLSNTVPARSEKRFAGWCDEATTTDSQSGDDICSGNLYAAGDDLPIDQTAGPNITLHAVWVETLFPIVWSQMGACEFHGATNGNITGTECTDYHDVKFIDTGIALYNQSNYLKDYEIHFTIDHYVPSEQVNYDPTDNSQQTFVGDKLSTTAGDGNAPGVIVRRSGNSIQFSSKLNTAQVNETAAASTTQDVSVYRLDNVIYYSVNGGPLILLQDITGFNQQFGLTTWFGAYPSDNCTGDLEPCTNAKRIPEATLSNMYIRLGEYSDEDVHTIVFNANGGAPATTTYLVKDGNSITTLPSAPTYANHLFQGWFTAQSSGTQVTAATVPDSSTTYFAHWLSTVALANITNDDITLDPNDTETINVTNSAELEPYTFSSDNTNVATVDVNTGEITAVAPGIATVTMTGATSGATKTISVTVSGNTFTVNFDSQGGSTVNPVTVGEGASIDPLPTSTKTDYSLEGWYTGTNGSGTKLTTSTIFDANTPTQYYANWVAVTNVCRVGTVQHTETCNIGSRNNGCIAAGYADGAEIRYGSLITVSGTTPVNGDAFTCDVNNDTIFDEQDERFYFIGMNGDNAKLLYYKNISNINESYANGLTRLPTSNTTGWTNPDLITYGSTDYNGDYDGKVARYMMRDEAVSLCNNNTNGLGSNGRCLYILEETNFANDDRVDGYWLGSTNNSRVQTASRGITAGSSNNGVHPVIEVPMNLVSLEVPQPVIKHEITFDPQNNGESSILVIEVEDGDAIDSDMPGNPSYTDHLFQRWYDTSNDNTVDGSTVPTGDMTVYAEWKGTVALANIPNINLALEENTTVSIHVTNSSDIEAYSFISNDTSVVTVDSSTGAVTGVSNGTTTITMTGATSGATKTINVTVTDLLPVTQAVISNDDLTFDVGDQVAIVVSNSALLEPYTFSSDDTSVATVDTYSGLITGVGVGTTNIIMTGEITGLTKSLEIDVTAVPVPKRTVTFDANGGTTPTPAASIQVDDGDPVGSLPTTTRTNYRFFGWYKDDGTFYQEVYPEEIIDSDVTFYARWVEDTASFPILFSETNACTFGGNGVNVSGTYCSQPKTKSYIDSAVSLYTSTNYDSDYEIGFTIVDYSSDNIYQATLLAAKYENDSAKWPGLAVRRYNNSSNMEFTHSMGGTKNYDSNTLVSNVQRVKIIRESGVIKFSVNDGSFTTIQDTNSLTEQNFDHTVWFGASAKENKTPQREFIGTLTDMYVKLGAQTEYVINFDPDGGSLASGEESKTITIGQPVGQLPTPTPPSADYTFDAWYDESVSPAVAITASTVPTSRKTYVAHYTYQSSNTPVVFDVSNDATRGYQSLIADWAQSPVNITTFNEASPINNSTWGDTSELSELDYWEGIRDNFVDNECLIPSSSDATKPLSALQAWTSGSVDCSKPDAYDTKINAALTVRLNNAQGAQVNYTKSDNGVISNMIPGQTYYWEKSDDSSVYGYVTATSNKGTRWVDTGSIRNVRDLGGLPVTYTDGNNQTVTGTTVYGRLFRGEKLNSSPATELTNLGITTEYNVGDEYSSDTHLSDYHLNQVIHYNFDYNSGDENNPNSNYMKAWTAVTNIMNDITDTNNPKNVYFHCRVGADRTGTVAYLLEGLLGVPDEDRYEEYALTNLSGLYDRTRYYKQKSSTNNQKFVFMMGFVKTNADVYNWYMQNPNADANLIQSFRTAMTN